MSGHLLDQQPEERLFTQIKELQDQIKELRTLQTQGNDALNLQLSGTTTLYWPALVNNQEGFVSFTLSNGVGKRLFGFPNITFYEGSVAPGNEIGHGNARDGGYVWSTWTDWGDTDNNNVVGRAVVINKTGSTQVIYVACNWRYLVSSGSGTGTT